MGAGTAMKQSTVEMLAAKTANTRVAFHCGHDAFTEVENFAEKIAFVLVQTVRVRSQKTNLVVARHVRDTQIPF